MANGEAFNGCNEVDKSCNQGCEVSDQRYKCTSNFVGEDSYILWDCDPDLVNPVCTQRLNHHHHPYSGFHCSLCCINKNCGLLNAPMCF